jgi:putative intracellular protease/amidase
MRIHGRCKEEAVYMMHSKCKIRGMSKRVLIPLPDRDFDPTEVAVPWRLLTRAGHTVVFATETGGARPACDPKLLTGVIFGKLGAAPEPKQFYREMEEAPELSSPISYDAIDPAAFDALLLPGGHAPGMKQYLGSETLQRKVAELWSRDKIVAAICHGVLVLARTRLPSTGQSPLRDRKTTCLPKYLERNGWLATFWKLGRYYRTYPEYVEDEVRAALADPRAQFQGGPAIFGARGIDGDPRWAFVVDDGRYLSGRWPGDAYLLARKLIERLA